jgi:peptidoglycan hydrolase FlgJ
VGAEWLAGGFGRLPGVSAKIGQTPAARSESLRQVSREFEAIFIQQMIAAMRKTVGQGGLLEKSTGEQIFESMLDEEWARKMAGNGGPGSLSEILYRQLSRNCGLDEKTAEVPGRAADRSRPEGAGAATRAVPAQSGRSGMAEGDDHE